MTAKKQKTTKRKVVQKSARQVEVQQALQHTWLLKGQLKTIQMSYLRIGAMLVTVRDEKMYASLGHADIEDYAEKRLNLGQSSLYQYIRVYDWAKAKHPEWLEKHPKGFIPELSDVADLMWIEEKLADPKLAGETRSKLQALRAKALEGKLRQRDLREFRVKSKAGSDPMKVLLSSLNTMRRRCLRLKDIPPEAISKLEDVIEVIQNALAVGKAGKTLDGAA